MWLEAILSQDDLKRAVGQLVPLRIDLGVDGSTLSIGEPQSVSLVKDVGLRIECPAEITWPVLGLSVPVFLHKVTFLIVPSVEKRDGIEELLFKPRLEHADFAGVPGIVDNKITDLINAELEKRKLELTWEFEKTLHNVLALPTLLQPARTLSLRAHGAMVRITEEALVLAIAMHGDIVATETVVEPVAPPASVPETMHPREPVRVNAPTPLIAAGVALASLGLAFAFGRMTSRGR